MNPTPVSEVQNDSRPSGASMRPSADSPGTSGYELARSKESAFAPPGTMRQRVLQIGRRVFCALPKLRDRRWVRQKLEITFHRARGSLTLFLRPLGHAGARLAGRAGYARALPATLPRFPILDHASVSIIIPVFNHCADTLACLDSIARLTESRDFEVIVVDDGSTDDTADMLGRVTGLVSLRNDRNLGFIGSCNRGAAAATGRSSCVLEQ